VHASKGALGGRRTAGEWAKNHRVEIFRCAVLPEQTGAVEKIRVSGRARGSKGWAGGLIRRCSGGVGEMGGQGEVGYLLLGRWKKPKGGMVLGKSSGPLITFCGVREIGEKGKGI